MWALLFAVLGTAVFATAVIGYRGLRSDPLAALSADDRALIRDPRTARSRQRGFFGSLGLRLGPPLAELLGSPYRSFIERRLLLADRHKYPDYTTFMASKAAILVIAGGAGLALALMTSNPAFAVIALLAGFFVPDLLLHLNGRSRQERIEDDLPDFLDVLSVTVSAGLSFRSALRKVTERTEGPLAEEVQTTLRQMDVGEPMYAAFSALRDRTDSDSLNTFVNALLQSEELGAPLADALQQIAVDMRRTTAQRARQKAAKASPKIASVVTLIMVPGTMALMLVVIYFVAGLDEGSLFG